MTEYQKEKDKLARAYQDVFSSDNGKLVLEDLRRSCGFDVSSVCVQAPNTSQTMFCEGKRWVFIFIKNQLERKFDGTDNGPRSTDN